MKKRILSIMLTIAMLLAANINAFAAESTDPIVSDSVEINFVGPDAEIDASYTYINSLNFSTSQGETVTKSCSLSGYSSYLVKCVLCGPVGADCILNLTYPSGSTSKTQYIFAGTISSTNETYSVTCSGSGTYTLSLYTYSTSTYGAVALVTFYGK